MIPFDKKLLFGFSLLTLLAVFRISSPLHVLAASLNKTIVISLSREYLSAYQGNAIILQTPITSGGPKTPTPIGSYQILAKLHNFGAILRPSESALTQTSTSVDSKQLAEILSYLESTLTKNPGGGYQANWKIWWHTLQSVLSVLCSPGLASGASSTNRQ